MDLRACLWRATDLVAQIYSSLAQKFRLDDRVQLNDGPHC